MTKPTAQALRAGPLGGQDLSLLKAGSSVLRHGGGLWIGTFNRLPEDEADKARIWIDRQTTPTYSTDGLWQIGDLTYIGERGEDGWISAPEGGWSENPVPGTIVDYRVRTPGSLARQNSDGLLWEHTDEPGDITAFRLAEAPAQQDSQQGAGGGDGADYEEYHGHHSDCAVHNEPAMANGRCDCGERKRLMAGLEVLREAYESKRDDLIIHDVVVGATKAIAELEAIAAWNRRSPSGHTGGPVAWRVEYRMPNGTMSGTSLFGSKASAEFARQKTTQRTTVTPLYEHPPAAQQDGGSGGGEAVIDAIADFLLERAEALEPGEDCHVERTESARYILGLIGGWDVVGRVAASLREIAGKVEAQGKPITAEAIYGNAVALESLSALQSAHPASEGLGSSLRDTHRAADGAVLADAERVLRQRFPGVFDPKDPLDLAEFPGLKNLATEHIAGLLLDIAKDRLIAHPASGAEDVETGWLVESDADGPIYHQVKGSVTRNAAEALRFSRQQDAEAFIKAYGPNHYDSILTPAWKAVEHRWG